VWQYTQSGVERYALSFQRLTDGDAGAWNRGGAALWTAIWMDCVRCAREYRLYGLGRSALYAAGSSEPVAPDNDFFIAFAPDRAGSSRNVSSEPCD